ncbi:hypothetical protein CA85_00550 [Allorhodopirellula solitaria]|uniref:Uncharacterized protein n=1 Tax=Allorhodopirellula solitaria TaxID=2527987 RepID=A0A5C5YIT3_9BACT|nr:hypothetical protein CA85_00550 [Allorhodopirellula solitaria]
MHVGSTGYSTDHCRPLRGPQSLTDSSACSASTGRVSAQTGGAVWLQCRPTAPPVGSGEVLEPMASCAWWGGEVCIL